MDDRELLIRYRDGELGERETQAVRERLQDEPELRAGLSRLEHLSGDLARSAADSFGPFFATRVMAGIRADIRSTPDLMYEGLRWAFARVAVVAAVIVVAIGTYSAIDGGYSATVVDAMLGLPDVTLESAMALGG